MSNLKKEFDEKYAQFLALKGLEKGTFLVPVTDILKSFKAFAPTTPISVWRLGRRLTKSFLKKQANTTDGIIQAYYLNKRIGSRIGGRKRKTTRSHSKHV